ncbi:MAG: efflux RND transporter periplasmic adaptor subunit [Chromatiales bacterium]|nr:MAG: efflux RND transporter periplasmic adaptor subunit [Chromatiales bacterium]
MPMSCLARSLRVVAPLALAGLVLGCAEEPPPQAESIRTVRTITVAQPASGRARRFSGLVEAANVTNVSFEVAGIVNALKVDVGDRIENGQVLAIMDESRYQLNVDAAQAAVRAAEVELRDAQTTFERLRRVNEAAPGATSDLDLDQAEATRDGARQNLSYATSRLNLAQRDLRLTELRSPFEGVIAERHVDAFQQVNRGQKIYSLFMEGTMEAAISVPESEIRDVYLGLRGQVRLPALGNATFPAIVSELSEVAGAGNAFPVRLAIDADNPQIRPGLTAEISLVFGEADGPRDYLIPLGALGSRADAQGSFVFRYDANSATVQQVPVVYGDIRGSDVVVEGELNPGDIIVVAGVSFLQDGQQVRLMQ